MKSKKYGKILAALLCAGLLAGWHAPPVFAVDITVTVTEENQTEIQGTFELADTDIDTAVTDEEKQSVAIGTNAEAGGERSTVIGYGAESNNFANDATVIGYGAKAENNNYATVLGAKAYTNHLNSVAIGYGSQTSQGGTVSFGDLGVNKIGAPDYRNLEGIEDVYIHGGIIFTDDGASAAEDLAQGELLGVTKINGIGLSYTTDESGAITSSSFGEIDFGADGKVTGINDTLLFDDTGAVKKINGIGYSGSTIGNATDGYVESINDSVKFDTTTGLVTDINKIGVGESFIGSIEFSTDGTYVEKITVGKGDGVTTITDTEVTTTTVSATDVKATNVTATTVTTGQTTIDNAGISIADKTVITDSDVVINKGTAGQVSLADVGQRMTVAENRIDRLGEEIDEVGALSAALAGLHPNPINANSRADFAMAVGSYDGESAIAAGAFYRPDKRTMLSLGASATSGSQMFNMGVTFALDRLPEKPAADSEVLAAVMARLEKLEAENAQLRAQYAELKEQTAQ